MNTTIRETYPMMSLAYVMSRLVNIRKKYNKDLLYYFERFKWERNTDKIQLWKHFLNSFIKKQSTLN